MWIVSKNGFFSVVEKPGDRERGVLTVRGRILEDMEWFKDNISWESEIVSTPKADYGYRMQVARQQFEQALLAMARDIDYANFKGNFSGEPEYEDKENRAQIYFRVWDSLAFLEYLDD